MKILVKSTGILVMLMFAKIGFAQPSWSVNPSDFQFSMNVIGVVNVNGIEETDANNIVGVFVGTEVRGVINTNVVVSGRNLAFLQIYSNVSQGETLTFKVYDASSNTEIELINTLTFEDGALVGGNTDPLELRDNNAPTALNLDNLSVLENQPTGTSIGLFATTDIETSDIHTYTLVDGVGDEDNVSFTINGSSLLSNEIFDAEIKNSYAVRVRTTDQRGGTFEAFFTISISDAPDAPTDISLSNDQVDENKIAGSKVGDFSTLDQDAADTHTYALVAGFGDIDNSSFSISENSLTTTEVFNFEEKSSYSIRIATEDKDGLTYEEVFIISVNDIIDSPTDIVMDSQRISENQDAGAIVGLFTLIDDDAPSPTFALVPGTNDNSFFDINGNQLVTTETFDHESEDQLFIDILANDGNGEEFSKRFIINVLDANDIPTDISLSDLSILEELPIGANVGLFSTVDQDATDTHTYTLVPGTGDSGNDAFTISNNQLQSAIAFDFEMQSNYIIRVRATDANDAFVEKSFSIMVEDSSDGPTDISLSTSEIAEESAVNSLVGTLTTTDEDASDTFSYALVGGDGSTDNDSFNINGNQLLTSVVFDA
ncbi:MAG: cadherin repeat domain-containing protein, partial [Bacteroidota bacterium]